MKNAQLQTMKHNVGDLADRVASNASAWTDNLADEAQYSVAKAGNQLAEWTETHGHQVAGLMSVGGRRVRQLVLARPWLCLTLAAGAGALAVYWLTRRYAQTERQAGAHDESRLDTSSQADA